MNRERARELLEDLARGGRSVESALEALAMPAAVEMQDAHLDTHRLLRTGQPEVVYGAGKSGEQILAILSRLAELGHDALVTRASPEKAAIVQAGLPAVEWHPLPGILRLRGEHAAAGVPGTVAVICAGTSDLAVAEEAAMVAEAMGLTVERYADIGVAGLHRLLGKLEGIRQAKVLIVVAGMEGALPSVVAGLVRQPVIAVPTSVGYGASFGGIAALLGMLNSCAAGVSVVNIDNGFGAAMVAARILAGAR